MSDIFLVKRLLSRMNDLGSNYTNIETLARAAAADLLIYSSHPVVELAKEYALYELRMIRDGKPKLSLGTWYARRRKQWLSHGSSNKPSSSA